MTDYTDIVAALREVPGVADADVEPDDDGGLGVLRLGLDPGVDEVAVATRVGRLLREQFGLGVDADRVQLIEDAASPVVPLQANGRRPVISRMQLVSSGLDVTATVVLAYRDQTAHGESTGTATQSGVHRAVATAALHAIEELIGNKARFEVDTVEVNAAGRDRTVLVSVTMVSGTGTDRLTGSAIVREDVRQAAIRAALDAVNRRLEPLLP
jgi:IMP dehydrogenase/GMP reductase